MTTVIKARKPLIEVGQQQAVTSNVAEEDMTVEAFLEKQCEQIIQVGRAEITSFITHTRTHSYLLTYSLTHSLLDLWLV